jgi:hypothetical protein
VSGCQGVALPAAAGVPLVQAALGGDDAGIESVLTHVSLNGNYTAATLQEVIDNNNWSTFRPTVEYLPLSGDYPLHVLVNMMHTTDWEVLPATQAKRKRAKKIAYPEEEELKHNRSDKDDPSDDGGNAPKRDCTPGHPGGLGGGGQGLSV